MEIAPITGIRFSPVAPRPIVAGVNAPLFDIVELTRIGADLYEGYPREESRQGMENEYEEMLNEEDDFEEPLYARAYRPRTGNRLNCFA